MGKTVRELHSSLDSRELSEWKIYKNLDEWKAFLEEKQKTEDEKTNEMIGQLFRGLEVIHE